MNNDVYLTFKLFLYLVIQISLYVDKLVSVNCISGVQKQTYYRLN